MENKLLRSQDNRLIAGVCGGIAQYFAIDATLVRLGMVFMSMVTGVMPGIVFYFVATIIMPEES